jgi:flagellar biosynthesis protein
MVEEYNQKGSKKNIKRHIDHLSLPKDRSKVRAVAIKYDVKKGKAPRIMATGKGAMAEMILKVAEEHRVPFYEDASLADLLSKLELDSEVAPELYTLVAEVLAFVYQLDKLAKKRQSVQQRAKASPRDKGR